MKRYFAAFLLLAIPVLLRAQEQFVNGDFSLPGTLSALGDCNGGTGWASSPWPNAPEYTIYPSTVLNNKWCIDLTPCHVFGNGAWIQQTLATTPGTCYRVQVDLGTICGWDGSDAGVNVLINGVQVGPRVFNDSFICLPDTACWKTCYSAAFTATGPSTVIRLVGEGRLSAVSALTHNGVAGTIGNPGFIGVDNVKLIPASLAGDAINLGRDTTLCAPFAFPLSANVVADSYQWSTGDTGSSIMATTPGTYWVRAQGQCSGLAIDTIHIGQQLLPDVSLPDSVKGCAGIPVQLTAEPQHAESLLWSTGATGMVIPVTTAGTYWVQAKNSCGIAADTTMVYITPQPSVQLPETVSLCGQDVVQLTAVTDDSTALHWSTGVTSAGSITVGEEGNYWAEVSNSCGSSHAGVAVTDCPSDVTAPTAFTPNGDGRNDTWAVSGRNGAKVLDVTVYNRWGQLVFYTAGDRHWDGTWNGMLQPVGTYYYRINYMPRRKATVVAVQGDVTLIR